MMYELAKVQRKRISQRLVRWVKTENLEVEALVSEYEKKFIEQAIANQIG